MGLVNSLMRKKGGKLGILMLVVKLAMKLLGRRSRHSHYHPRYNRRFDSRYGREDGYKKRELTMKQALKQGAFDAIGRRGSRW